MKRFLALLAACALALSLVGCTPAATPPDPSPLESTPVGTESDDVIFRIAGVPASTTLLTVDGAPVSAEIFVYWLLYNTSYYDSYMQYYGQTLDWAEDMGGETLASYLMGDSIEAVKFFSQMITRAAQYGCGLTDEQVLALADQRQSLVDQFGSEEELAFNLRYAGISEDTLTALNSTAYFYENLATHFYGGANAPSDAELADYIETQELFWAKHILIRTLDDADEPLPEEELADAKARAEAILAQLLAAGDGQAALFDDLMNQFSEDPGLASYPDGYDFGPGDMVPEFENATRALAIGEMTDALVETDYGYHIILRAAYPLSDTLVKQCINAKFDQLTSEWLAEATVVEEPELASIDVQAVYEATLTYRAELEAEHDDAVPQG